MYIDKASQVGLADACVVMGMADPLFHQFEALPLCENLTEQQSFMLFQCFDVVRCERGEEIYAAGSESDQTMRLIVDGRAEVSSPSYGVYGYLAVGDVFGLFSFLDEARVHSATVKAETDVIVLTIRRAYFNLITVEDAALGNLLLRSMFRLLSRMSLKMENEYAAMHHYVTGLHC